MHKRAARIIFATATSLLVVLLVVPLWAVIRGGFFVGGSFTLKYLAGVFQNPVYVEGLVQSIAIATGTTTLVVCIGLPLAWISHRFDFAGKKWLSGMILLPMILPPFVGAIGFQQVFGQYGALNALLGLGPVDWLGRGRYFGVIILQALSLYPILYLNAVAALANVDPAMEEAAENVGCTGLKKFLRITLPLIMPGLFAGGVLVFIWSLTELGTPLIMNYTRCAPVQIFDALKEIGTNPFPYALVTVLLAVSIALYSLSRFFFGRKGEAMQSRATTAAVARPLTGLNAFTAALPFLGVMLLALLPHLGVVLTSFAVPGSWYRSVLPAAFTSGNYVEALGHELTLGSIKNSILFSSLAVGFDLLLGVAIAFVLVRSALRGRGFLDMLSMLPLAIPGLVMAFGYLAISSWLSNLDWVKADPFWQNLLDVRRNPTVFLVIAYGIRRLPYMVRAAVAGLQQTSVVFEESAANLGAGLSTTLRRVTLPLIAANLIAGGLLAFAFSMLEVSDSLMLAQSQEFFPITKAIYELFQLIGTGKYVAAALGVWAMLFLSMTIMGCSMLLGKKMGALFRIS